MLTAKSNWTKKEGSIDDWFLKIDDLHLSIDYYGPFNYIWTVEIDGYFKNETSTSLIHAEKRAMEYCKQELNIIIEKGKKMQEVLWLLPD